MRRATRYFFTRGCLFTLALLFFFNEGMTQDPDKIYTVKNGNMYIRLKKKIDLKDLDAFIAQFDLKELALKRLILNGLDDSIKMAGWEIEKNTKDEVVILKPLFSSGDIIDPGELIIFTGQHPPYNAMFPAVSNRVTAGFNRFRGKEPFSIKDSVTRFYLHKNLDAKKVMLAGSFNDWNPSTLSMIKTDSGWIADVRLSPGKYWYKFIIDGKWIIDTDNLNNENDGLGNTNSVYYVTNYIFSLNGFTNAKKVLLSGSFNNWDEKAFVMNRTANGWELPLYLGEGTHTYRFIIDGKWITDPGNPESLPNEFNESNSVVRIGKPYLFKIGGYENAKQVILTGSFNGWRNNELFLNKTANGWELPHVLAAGNYEYIFIIDGKRVPDPLVSKTAKGNSLLILQPNHNFRVTGLEKASSVFIAGDFNNWEGGMIEMKKVNNEWLASAHLTPGKHLYKLIVDGKWMLDPGNKLWEQNEHQTGNSVLWIEK